MVVAGSTAANEKFSMGRSVSILVVRLAGRTYWMGCLTEILQYTIVMTSLQDIDPDMQALLVEDI